MATYWKSQPRKFCDYCKCWITDNKPSVDFHEKGKKHQENVKRRIEEIKKKSVKDGADKKEQDDDMRKMEKAAIAAFKKDLENDPELAAKYGVKVITEEPKEEERPVYGPDLPPETEEWCEAQSDEGYTYYWNTKTGESVWEKPDGFQSTVEENTEETNLSSTVDTIPLPEEKPANIELPKPDEIPLPSECPAPVREKVVYTAERSDTSRVAYGQWAAVVEEPAFENIDLQLPEQPVENIPLPPPSFTQEETKVKFKEKRVTSLGDGEPVAFKKRKIMNKSRNTRKRDDDS